MYNKDHKIKFINMYTNNIEKIDYYVGVFNLLEFLECKKNRDICNIKSETIVDFLNNISGQRKYSKWEVILLLRDYYAWCDCIKYNNKSYRFSYSDSTISDIKNKMVCNPPSLENYLNKLYKPPSSNTIDNIYRCYHWLVYSGLSEEDLYRVTKHNIDLTNRCILLDKNEYVLYDESIESVKNCCNRKSFVYSHPRYMTEINRVSGTSIIRGIESLRNINNMKKYISRVANNSDSEVVLSYSGIRLSGINYRILQAEKLGFGINLHEVVTETADIHLRKLHERKYLDKYIQWKIAFDV